MVDSVVSAALGGNASSTAALRSLAGVGAANTEFLRALAQNPQQVFASMFQNLARLQGMSSDNFMEVAEGLSSIFGVSMDAFARVDFNYLAQAISKMNVNNASLDENMALLVSGQTTSTAEQLRMEQVNQYMIEEGLSYVLDNQVARSIQEHMWDEQMKRELQQTTYGVEVQGATLALLQGLKQTVEGVLNLLNPLSYIKKIVNVIEANKESKAQQKDIQALLEAGKIGSGNKSVFKNLTTTNASLGLTQNYLEMLGLSSNYAAAHENTLKWARRTGQSAAYGASWGDVALSGIGSLLGGVVGIGAGLSSSNPLLAFTGGMIGNEIGGLISDYASANKGGRVSSTALGALMGAAAGTSSLKYAGPKSNYQWGTLGKSITRALGTTGASGASPYALLSASQQITDKSSARFQSFLDTMDKYVEKNKTYEEWAATATKYGVADLSAALEENGLTETDLRGAFQDREVAQAAQYQHEREVNEDKFWETGTNFWAVVHPEFQDVMKDLSEQQLDQMILVNKQLTEFYNQWIDYYVNHTAYSRETLNAYDVAAIRNAEKSESGDAILALANALSSNMVDLKDPAVQQNALLAKILLVCEAIMQQNNNTSTVSLPTALASLGMGILQ